MMTKEETLKNIPANEECGSISLTYDLYQSFWIFVTGSAFGFIIETIWCFLKHGRLEYRSSLLFMPLTLVYGCGSLVLYFGTRIIDKSKLMHIFAFGAVSCTVMEYLSSLLQETFFGTVSWDYSKEFLNIEGRVCLPLTIAWGFLAVFWLIAAQPFLENLISRIPVSLYKPLTWILVILLILNAVISAAAVVRWGCRLDGIPSTNMITAALDSLFPNELMCKYYPNMRFPKGF